MADGQNEKIRYDEDARFDELIRNGDYPPWPEDIVSTWSMGAQLVHAAETESALPGHKQGAIQLVHLMQNFDAESREQVTIRHIDNILEIICTFDRVDLLSMLVNHPYLSEFFKPDLTSSSSEFLKPDLTSSSTSKQQHRALQGCLKKAMRTGKIGVLRYLITQNVIPMQLFHDKLCDAKQYENDIKSLLFNILRAVEIAAKNQNMHCLQCADTFWPYLTANVIVDADDAKSNTKDVLADNMALKQLIDDDADSMQFDIVDYALIKKLKAMNRDAMVIKYISLFMTTMFSYQKPQCIQPDVLNPIFAVLRFQRERYITFEDRDVDYVRIPGVLVSNNVWKLLYKQLVYTHVYTTRLRVHNNEPVPGKDESIPLQMIDYLISGGVAVDDTDKATMILNNNPQLMQAVQRGEYNWSLRTIIQDNEKIEAVIAAPLPLPIR
eukprot:CAMPEP_0202730156 /NCGR_PEP_ID=MMETSP1385-20130828/186498_1 /ASSEMBLY_ACC=CAM_ASM_000861 /TAXON_ID=933848 /ORGANISM="Elphidium margaritaceum" /LENGTH=437 /DNA_ID=CAMNT_0049396429 /DNA_START=8 /DNA_END=1319 /DNA_ORIENTATION=+